MYFCKLTFGGTCGKARYGEGGFSWRYAVLGSYAVPLVRGPGIGSPDLS
jgi:hypothetical protein